MIAIVVLVLATIYWCEILTSFLVRNFKAHKFFQTKSPQLPVVPNASIFSGHAMSILAPDKNWKIIEDLHDKYGPTFGYYMMEQPWVSTKDLDLIKLVEIDEAHKHINRAFLGLPFTEFNNSIWHNENEQWRQVRRTIAPALTNRVVRSDDVSLDIESIVGQLAAAMERRVERARKQQAAADCNDHESTTGSFIMEARDLSERFTLAVIFLTTYKQSNVIDFDCDEDSWVRLITLAAHEITNPIQYVSMALPALRPLCEWINLQFSYTGQLQKRIVNFIKEATNLNRLALEHRTKATLSASGGGAEGEKIKSNNEDRASVFKRRLCDPIIDSFFERKIRYEELVGSLLFLLLAGFMTTADTITCLLWHLARSPQVQDKLRKTILEEGIDADYVLWCINEAVRYHPAVPLGTGRVLGDDVTINGQFLAKGSFIMPTTHGIHHDAKIWPQPERFWPERWRDQAKFHPAQFVGFGLGPRNCAGGKLAVYEIKLVMRMILSNYRVETCNETPDEWRFSSGSLLLTLNDDPIKVRFAPLKRGDAVQA